MKVVLLEWDTYEGEETKILGILEELNEKSFSSVIDKINEHLNDEFSDFLDDDSIDEIKIQLFENQKFARFGDHSVVRIKDIEKLD